MTQIMGPVKLWAESPAIDERNVNGYEESKACGKGVEVEEKLVSAVQPFTRGTGEQQKS